MLTPEEMRAETGGIAEEWRIEVESLVDYDPDSEDAPDWQAALFPVDTPLRAEIAARMARCFHKETQYDFPPFVSEDFGTPNRHLYLIRSREFLRLIPVIAGAVEIRIVKDSPLLMWVWIHPFERGSHRSTWALAWDELVARHGDLYIQSPLSHTMRALADKVGVPNERRVVLRTS